MKRSLALGLYMLASRGGATAGPVQSARPPGPLVWLRGSKDSGPALAQLVEELAKNHPDIGLVVTPVAIALPPDVTGSAISAESPQENVAALRSFLDHWRPDLLVLIGTNLPPALIVECHDRGIPMLWADAEQAAQDRIATMLRGGLKRSLIRRLTAILARDADSVQALRHLAGGDLPVAVAGRIEATLDPLPCQDRERIALGELLGTRPVWLAAACPEAEEDAVIAAHARALRLAHRMLLIFVPADPGRATALAERMARDGWTVAQRAKEQEPEAGIEVLVADGLGELGLWYRLAPVCYMGGTLTAGSTRNPFEAAALGSAIVHGPHPGPYTDAYARLSESRAARRVESANDLAEAVGDLIAPDRAAILAHNAWATSSGGAEVTERVCQEIIRLLRRAAPEGAI